MIRISLSNTKAFEMYGFNITNHVFNQQEYSGLKNLYLNHRGLFNNIKRNTKHIILQDNVMTYSVLINNVTNKFDFHFK